MFLNVRGKPRGCIVAEGLQRNVEEHFKTITFQNITCCQKN